MAHHHDEVLKIVYWEDVRAEVYLVNPGLAEAIDQLILIIQCP